VPKQAGGTKKFLALANPNATKREAQRLPTQRYLIYKDFGEMQVPSLDFLKIKDYL
jgi:hypothetical protein